MLILFMDDQEIRHDLAEKYLSKDHVILHAYTADEAIGIILACQERIGLAMLDHDLQDFYTGEDGCKYERHGVYFLERMFRDVPKDMLPAQFILHSFNPVGVNNMYAILKGKNLLGVNISFSGDAMRSIAERIRPQ